jgi:hypothetical protein
MRFLTLTVHAVIWPHLEQNNFFSGSIYRMLLQWAHLRWIHGTG